MQTKRQSYFGLGPRIFRPAMVLAFAGGAAAWLEPDIFRMGPLFLQPLRLILGWMFVLAGAAFCLWGVLRMFPAVQGGKLDTGGPFALVRHPIYSGWIVFLFPGIALVTGAWLVSAASVLAWLAFRKWVPIEEQALLDRFGQPYREYMDRTPALFPFPK